MSDFDVADREFIKHAFAAEKSGLDLYLLHERYLLSPGQISRSLRKMLELGLVTYANGRVAFSSRGRVWIVKNRVKIFYAREELPWKKMPSTYIAGDSSLWKSPKISEVGSSFLDDFR